MVRAPILMLMLSLAACKVDTKASANGDENVSIKADQAGNISFDVPFAKGQVKIPGGSLHGSNFDIDGVKLMPGSNVTGFSLQANGGPTTVKLSFTAPASPNAVRAYFVDQFKRKGVEAVAAGDTVTGKSKDGSPFVIRVAPAAGGSSGTIEVEDDED